MLRRKPPKIITRSTIAAAVKSLVANDDLLLEIFLRLPIRSLLRFKSVSKRWLSLISDPNFCHRRSAFQPLTPPSVILFRPYCSRFSSGSDLDYMDPNAPRVPYRSLEPTISECRIVILQSCNGLFLGRSYEKNVYYVYNPTTKQYKMLPMLKIIKNRVTLDLNLPYDPLQSPNYEVVCFRVVDSTNYQIKICSSDSGFWRICCEGSFVDRFIKEIDRGVYWNGAVHWVRDCGKGIYFNLSEEKLHEFPIPGASNDQGHKIV